MGRLCLYAVGLAVLLGITAFVKPIRVSVDEEQRRAVLPEGDHLYMHGGDGKRRTHWHAGEKFWLRVVKSQLQDCRITISYRVINEVSEAVGFGGKTQTMRHRIVYHTYPLTQAANSTGHYVTDYLLTLPDLEPGDYMFDAVRIYYCGVIAQNAIVQNSRTTFTIEPPSGQPAP